MWLMVHVFSPAAWGRCCDREEKRRFENEDDDVEWQTRDLEEAAGQGLHVLAAALFSLTIDSRGCKTSGTKDRRTVLMRVSLR